MCTGGELAVARRAQFPAERIGFHGNNKTTAEIREALELRRRPHRRRLLPRDRPDRRRGGTSSASVAPVMVRVTVGVEAHTHEFIATGHEDQKFGFSLAGGQALEAAGRLLARPDVFDLRGLHSHIGSQIFDTGGFEMAARRLVGLHAQIVDEHGHHCPEIDLGGGYGIAYTSQHTPLSVATLAQEMADIVGRELKAVGDGDNTRVPRVSVEPGRAIVGPSTFTLYEVGTVKDVEVGGGHSRTYVSVDGGMSDNARPALYEADYSCTLASRRSEAEPRLSRVVGRHCESGDIVVLDEYLPADVVPGDLSPSRAPAPTAAACPASTTTPPARPSSPSVEAAHACSCGVRPSRTCSPSTWRTREDPQRGGWTPPWRTNPVPPCASRCSAAASWAPPSRPGSSRTPTTSPPGSGAQLELVGIAVRRPQRPRPDVPVDPALFTADADELVTRADVVIEVIGGIEPARSLILRAMEHGASVVSANKALLAEDGPTLYAAADEHDVDLYYEAAVAGRHPDPAPDPRVARRRRRAPGARHRQRHDQLRPRQDGHHRRRLRRDGRAGPGPGLRRGRPHRRRRGLRRRGQGRHPRRAWPSTPGSRSLDVHREGITEVTAGDIQAAERDGLRRQAARHLRAGRRRRRRRRGQRAGAPGDDPAQPPAGQRPRGVQRRVRRGGRRRRADVLRARARAATPRHPPCSATSSRSRGTRSPAGAGPGSRRTPTCRSSTWASR